VVTTTGSGANIAVTAILGDGEAISVSSDTIGAIQALRILAGGSGYIENPTINLRTRGDGTAQATANIISGVYTYPGRYLNDDGHLSGYNFLEDRDYYQPFSYVVRAPIGLNDYRATLLNLLHPAGTKLFGEYLFDEYSYQNDTLQEFTSIESNTIIFKCGIYASNLGNMSVTIVSHGYTTNDMIYLELVSGDTINVTNGIYTVINAANANTVFINHSANTINTNGKAYSSKVI
jgi:hypothetical protein